MIGTPIETLTTAQMRTELRKLYGVTDVSDCVETTDLQEKLAQVRNTQLITHGLRYGPLLQIGNKKDPTGVVTLSHGLGDSANGWQDVAEHLAGRLPHLLFLLPTAPVRPVTINGGMSMNAWYDIKDLNIGGGGRDGGDEVLVSADYVKSLAYVATQRHRIPSGRVVYAGFSQGAAVSLATGITALIAPAGIAVLSGYLAGAGEVLPQLRNKAVRVLMCHGTEDPVVPFAAAEKTLDALRKAGMTSVTLKKYRMEHSTHPKEMDDFEEFLREALPSMSSKA